MKTYKTVLPVALVLAIAGFAAYTVLSRKPPVHTSTGDVLLTDNNGTAIDGYDVVAYFTEGSPTEGTDEYTVEHDGATWKFASAKNRDAFLTDPSRYIPQYGGFCAWAISEKKTLIHSDPHAWKIVNDKLYLNVNQDVRSVWVDNQAEFIRKGDANWPDVQQSA